MPTIIDALNHRYATKQFDPTKTLTLEQEQTLHEALRLSPSSFGLQAWKFFIVKNKEIKTKLREAAWDQAQLTSASEVVVFAVPKVIDDSTVDAYIASVAATRGVPLESLAGYAQMIKGFIAPMDMEARKAWATKQVYIALGVLLTSAAIEGIDACPMEGFDKTAFDAILNLEAQGYESRVIATLGFRAESDQMAHAAKVRLAPEQVITVIE